MGHAPHRRSLGGRAGAGGQGATSGDGGGSGPPLGMGGKEGGMGHGPCRQLRHYFTLHNFSLHFLLRGIDIVVRGDYSKRCV
jgi:hypothetical protein